MAQFTITVPDALVPRFRAVLPPNLTPEEAVVRLIKMAIRDTEQRIFVNQEGAAQEVRVRQHLAELNAELGLP